MTHKKVWESLLLYSTRNSQPVDIYLNAPRPAGYAEFRQRYAYMVADIDESEYPAYIHFGYRDIARMKKENLPDIFTGELGLIFV
ncbi:MULTISPECIES: hypothetical protein [unclassified Ruegeria]|uniref:hypothetical protein n=1 Tax=unclassified Ruegeria TaxID=2625375 RepID=UPI001487D7C5|nr:MULTISPECIES: hypothetical protein [unclassified Ruegeria]